MNQPLTIAQAEAVLTRAAGHPVKVWRDFNGYFARTAPADYLALYDQTRMNPDNTSIITVTPAVGDWPEVDLSDCPIPAESPLQDWLDTRREGLGG